MGAVTASATYRESSGSLTHHIFTIASIDTSTFATGIPGVVAYYAATDSAYPISIIPVATGNTGTTFNLVSQTAATGVKLYVLSKS